MSILSITASTAPLLGLIANFWEKWHHTCEQHFGPDAATRQSIETFKTGVQTQAMFTHLNEGLEELLLNDRANQDLALTSQAWLALTWLVLNEALVKCALVDRATMLDTVYPHVVSVVNKTSSLYKSSNGKPIAGVSMKQWIEHGPWWHDNQVFWSMLFHQQLTMVHPHKTPLLWTMREYWMAAHDDNGDNKAQTMVNTFWGGEVDMSPWGLDLPVTASNVRNALRNAKRWTRNGTTLLDIPTLYNGAPQWTGVYLFALWMHQPQSDENNKLLQSYLLPQNLVYWLVLSHLNSEAVTKLGLNSQPQYAAHQNIMEGLQLLDNIEPLDLALAAHERWKNHACIDSTPLPEL